nr:membrane hypothetical protein [Rhizobiaceae bacterium]
MRAAGGCRRPSPKRMKMRSVRPRHGAHQRRDAADGDAAVLLLGNLRLHLQEALAITLRLQVFRRNAVDVRQEARDRFGPLVGEDQVGLVGPHGIRMALDQEGLARILVQHLLHGLGDGAQRAGLRHRHVGAAGGEGDRVEVDAAHLVAQARGMLHLVDRIDPLDALDRRLREEVVIIPVRIARRVDDVVADGNAQAHRRQLVADVDEARTRGVALQLRCIDEDVFPSVTADARALDDVAVAVVDRHDLDAAGTHDRLAHAPAGKVVVIDLFRITAQARAVVAAHDQPVSGLQHRAVLEALDDIHLGDAVVDRRVVDGVVVDDRVVDHGGVDDVGRLRHREVGRLLHALAFFLDRGLDPAGHGLAHLLGNRRLGGIVGVGNRHVLLLRAQFLALLAALFAAGLAAGIVGVLVAVEHGGPVLHRQHHRLVGRGRILGDFLLLLLGHRLDDLRHRLGRGRLAGPGRGGLVRAGFGRALLAGDRRLFPLARHRLVAFPGRRLVAFIGRRLAAFTARRLVALPGHRLVAGRRFGGAAVLLRGLFGLLLPGRLLLVLRLLLFGGLAVVRLPLLFFLGGAPGLVLGSLLFGRGLLRLFGRLLPFGLALLFFRGRALGFLFGRLLFGCGLLGVFSRLLLLRPALLLVRRRALGVLVRGLLFGGGAFRLFGGLLFLGLALLLFLGGALRLVLLLLLLLLEQQLLFARLAFAGAFLGNLERLHQGIGQCRRRDQRGRQDRQRHGCEKSGAESHRFILTVSRLALWRGPPGASGRLRARHSLQRPSHRRLNPA